MPYVVFQTANYSVKVVQILVGVLREIAAIRSVGNAILGLDIAVLIASHGVNRNILHRFGQQQSKCIIGVLIGAINTVDHRGNAHLGIVRPFAYAEEVGLGMAHNTHEQPHCYILPVAKLKHILILQSDEDASVFC